MDLAKQCCISDYVALPVFAGAGSANDAARVKVEEYVFHELLDIECQEW